MSRSSPGSSSRFFYKDAPANFAAIGGNSNKDVMCTAVINVRLMEHTSSTGPPTGSGTCRSLEYGSRDMGAPGTARSRVVAGA